MTNREFLANATDNDLSSFFAKGITCVGCFIWDFCKEQMKSQDLTCRETFGKWLLSRTIEASIAERNRKELKVEKQI